MTQRLLRSFTRAIYLVICYSFKLYIYLWWNRTRVHGKIQGKEKM